VNINQINDTVFEALFRQAVIDNFYEEIDSIPSNKQLSMMYSFSIGFEARMRKLFSRELRRNSFKNAMFYSRKIASILIIVLGLLFGALLFNNEVRAAVRKVLVEWYDKFTSFTLKDDDVVSEKKDWMLNYLPEGYSMKNYEVLSHITNMEFVNNQGNKIRFSYCLDEGITNISIDNENHEIFECEIMNNEAYCIIAIDDKFDNGVIWYMKGHVFDLWGKIPIDELKKIAESISEDK